MSDEITKKEVKQAGKILEQNGLINAFGHVSFRSQKGDSFFITPKKCPALAEPEELIEIDLHGNVVNGGIPPLETPFHTAVYNKPKDVNAICRIHPFYATVLSTAKISIKPMHGFGCHLEGEIPVYDNNTDLITTIEEAEDIVAAMGMASAIVIRANGCLVTGKTIKQACIRSLYVEEAAKLQYMAVSSNCKVAYLNQTEIAARASWCEEEQNRAWKYYLERIV